MADYRSEDPDGGFKKTFVAIAVVHLILLGGLMLAALFQSQKKSDTVVWMNPGSFGGEPSAAASRSDSATDTETTSSEVSPPENHQETPSPTPPARLCHK